MSFDSRAFLKTQTDLPGIYQMYDAKDELLYVGKARHLKKRLSSYFRSHTLSKKTAAMVGKIVRVEVMVTQSENEALILESNLIKQHKPHYNILLRDDKSYPYIRITAHDFPSVVSYRGAKKKGDDYFGPYPSGLAVHQTLKMLQKTFKIRQCTDSFFANRSRPCLQYQIKRCSGPCVDEISKPDYTAIIDYVRLVLSGKSQQLIDDLIQKMEAASGSQAFESAATLRDQVSSLRKIQEHQYINQGDRDADIIVAVVEATVACVYVASIRGGLLLGGKAYFPVMPEALQPADVLSAFLPQYYLSAAQAKILPNDIYVNADLVDQHWLASALTEKATRKVTIQRPQRGDKTKWLQTAIDNARIALDAHIAKQTGISDGLVALQTAIDSPSPIARIECFDISHTQGEATVGSCVVLTEEGFCKSDYRRFNIKGITPGDDYAAMHQALSRRFRSSTAAAKLPDILLIDGGQGQLKQAETVLKTLEIEGVILLGIAKGEGRKADFDRILSWVNTQAQVIDISVKAKQLLQQLRDEAHRFAITGHRGQRDQKRRHSTLETIPGIGAKRRKALIQRFGGLQEIRGASAEELAKVPGINQALAEEIYRNLH